MPSICAMFGGSASLADEGNDVIMAEAVTDEQSHQSVYPHRRPIGR